MASEFSNPPLVQSFQGLPRFGATSYFPSLFEGRQQANDYVDGLVNAALIIFVVELLLSITILIFKFVGETRLGFMAGGPFRQPKVLKSRKGYDRTFICRLVFLNSGILFITFSIAFVVSGLNNMNESFEMINEAANDAARLSSDISTALNNATITRSQFNNLANTFVSQLQSNTSNECFPVSSVEPAIVSLRSSINEVVNATRLLQSKAAVKTSNRQCLLDYTSSTAESASDSTSEALSYGALEGVFVITFTIFPAVVLVGVFLATAGTTIPQLQRALTWIFLPLLCIQTLVAYSASAVALGALGGNSDFCYGEGANDPKPTVSDILILYECPNTTTYIHDTLMFYINGCSGPDPFLPIFDYYSGTQQLVIALEQMFARVASSGPVTPICSSELEVVTGIARQISTMAKILAENAATAFLLARCENIQPIYEKSVQTGACTYAVTALTWSFAALLIVGTFGHVMILLRSSWLPVEYYLVGKAANENEGPVRKSVRNGFLPFATVDEEKEEIESFLDEPQQKLKYQESAVVVPLSSGQYPHLYPNQSQGAKENEIKLPPSKLENFEDEPMQKSQRRSFGSKQTSRRQSLGEDRDKGTGQPQIISDFANFENQQARAQAQAGSNRELSVDTISAGGQSTEEFRPGFAEAETVPPSRYGSDGEATLGRSPAAKKVSPAGAAAAASVPAQRASTDWKNGQSTSDSDSLSDSDSSSGPDPDTPSDSGFSSLDSSVSDSGFSDADSSTDSELDEFEARLKRS